MSSKSWLRLLKDLHKAFVRKPFFRSRARRLSLLRLEPLEDRRLLAMLMVTNTFDSGVGSFRQAIIDSNSSLGTRETIDFAIPTSDPGYNSVTNAFTIKPSYSNFYALPPITDPVDIDGYSQSGASPNTLPVGDNAVLKIEISGANTSLNDYAVGLNISAGNTTVRGLVIDGFTDGGIYLVTNGSNVIQGNFIGTDVTGTVGVGGGLWGIYTESNNNIIGSQ